MAEIQTPPAEIVTSSQSEKVAPEPIVQANTSAVNAITAPVGNETTNLPDRVDFKEVQQDEVKPDLEQVNIPVYSEDNLRIKRIPLKPEELVALLGEGYVFKQGLRDGTPNAEIITIKKSAETTTTPDLPVLLIKEIHLNIAEYIDLGFTREQAEKLQELKISTSALITNFKDIMPERKNGGIKKIEEAQEVADIIAEFASIRCTSHIKLGLRKKFLMVGHTILRAQRQEPNRNGDTYTFSIQQLLFEKLITNPHLTLIVGHGGPDTGKEPMMERKKIVGSRFIGVDLDAGDALRILEQTGYLDQHVVIDTTCSGEPAAPGVLPEDLLDPHSQIGFDVISPMANIGGKFVAQSAAYWLHKSGGDQNRPGAISFSGFKG